MDNGFWLSIQKKYKNSVVQITTYSGNYNLGEPYKSPDIKSSRGSGFIITKQGHVLTNAHVVDAAITVTFRSEVSGNEDLKIDVISICHHKDVALLKIPDELLTKIEPFTPFEFADDHLAEPTSSVLTMGFPLGKEKIKFTTGVISGYETPDSEEGTTNQSYIQIDAAINKGNSGGPLTNSQGKVLGINAAGYLEAQNVGFAIPSRVVLSILRDMFNHQNNNFTNKLTTAPRLGVILQQVTVDHFIARGIDNEDQQTGLRVKEIIPGTPLKGIREGDIIKTIKYSDPFKDKNAFKIDGYFNDQCLRCNEKPDTIIHISRHGNIKLMDLRTNKELIFTKDRKVSLPEVLDTIPSNTPITLEILRNDKNISLDNLPFKNEELQGIYRLYPPFSPQEYVIFGGCVWVPLSTNILNIIGTSKYLCEFIPFKNRNMPRIMLSQIFPKTDIEQTKAFEISEVITKINGLIINTLADFRMVILSAYQENTYIIIETNSGNEITLDPEKVNDQDRYVHESFSIKPDEFTEQLWEFY